MPNHNLMGKARKDTRILCPRLNTAGRQLTR
jgi:hypothetical protein